MRLYTILYLLMIIDSGLSLRIRSLIPIANSYKISNNFQFNSNIQSSCSTDANDNNQAVKFHKKRKNLINDSDNNNSSNNMTSIQKHFKRFLSTFIISASLFSSGNIDISSSSNNILDYNSRNSNSYNNNNSKKNHVISYIASSRADDELANYAAQGNDVGVDGQCFIKKCGFETSGCANEPTCLKGLACLARCKGGSLCSTGCFAKYGSKSLDNLLYCSVEKNDCVRVPGKESLGWTIDTLADLPFKPSRSFDMSAMQGTWYKVMGLDSRYDCFDCQKNKFEIKNKDTLKMEALFRIPRPTYPGYLQSKINEELQLAAKDGSYFLSHMQSKGQMFGLTFWENWYVVSDDVNSNSNSNNKGKNKEKSDKDRNNLNDNNNNNNNDDDDDSKTDLVAIQQQMYKYQQQPISILSLVQPPSFLTTTANAAKSAASATTRSSLTTPFNTALFNLQAATTIPTLIPTNNNNDNNNDNNDKTQNIDDSKVDEKMDAINGAVDMIATTTTDASSATTASGATTAIGATTATDATTAATSFGSIITTPSTVTSLATVVITTASQNADGVGVESAQATTTKATSITSSSSSSSSVVKSQSPSLPPVEADVVQDGDYLPVGGLKLVYYTGHTLQGSYKGAFVLSRSPIVSPAVFNSASRLIRSANLNPLNFCMIRNQCFLSDGSSSSGSGGGTSGSNSNRRRNNNSNGNGNLMSGIDTYEQDDDQELPFWFIGQKFFKATNSIASELADWFEDPALLSDWLVGQQQRVILENPLAVSPFADLIQENKQY